MIMDKRKVGQAFISNMQDSTSDKELHCTCIWASEQYTCTCYQAAFVSYSKMFTRQ